MKFFYRNTWMVAVIFGFVISISSCQEIPPTIEPATITFVHQANESEYYEPLVEEFMERYPEVVVELSTAFGNNPEDYAQADVLGVDLFRYIQFRSQDVFLDLSPLVEQDNSFRFSDFYPGTVELFSENEKIWALPSGIDTFVLYYNKNLFDQNGFGYPTNDWTWDDLLAVASGIRKEPDTFGYGVPDPYLELYAMILIHQHGGQLFDDMDNPSGITYNQPLNVEAIQWFQDLYHLYDVAPTPEQASRSFGYGNQAIFRGVLQGDIGMWPGNFSDRGGITWPVSWDNISWGMVALPGDVSASTSGLGTGYAISARTENPEAAWLWLTFLTEQIPQALIPARRSLAESEEFQDQIGAEAASAAAKSIQHVTLISPDLFQFGNSLEYFSEAVNDIVDGTASAQEALDWAQDQVENP
jgi:ABC-type glycerol-3-phosphate transport system substrate-binding protein